MAYVAPHGTIQLYKNVPLTPDYEHTYWFESTVAQRAYFESKSPKTFYNQMYTRVHGNKVRVNVKSDDIATYNYMGFTNDYGAGNASKWYYAFIDEIEYINEQVTEITFTLDNIQSWFTSITFSECFIERQHSTTDDIGDNIQPEPIKPNEHICIPDTNLTKRYLFYPSDIGFVMSAAVYTALTNDIFSSDLFHQSEFGGLGSCVRLLYFSSISQVNFFLKSVDVNNGILQVVGVGGIQPLALYAVPGNLFYSTGNGYIPISIGSFQNICYLLPVYANEFGGDILNAPRYQGEGPYYTPKNKKLFTYPYSFIRASFPTLHQDYKFENFFNGGKTAFRVYATCNPVPSVMIVPVSYERDNDQYHYALTLDNFPQLPIFQDGVSGVISGALIGGLKNIMLGLSSLLVGGATGGEVGDIGYIGKNVPSVNTSGNIKGSATASNLAPIMATKYRNGDVVTNEPVFEINFQQYGLRTETAKRFDEYFSRYGYAQNKVGIPNTHARTRYTYVKTRGCCAKGNAPAEAIRDMNKVMDNGITWWADHAIGSYTDLNGNLLDNPIRT